MIERTISELAAEIELCNTAKGWYDDRTFGDEIALAHSELSEALEAFRKRGFEAWLDETKGSPEGVGIELADTIIRVIDTATKRGIDLPACIERKIAFNWTRPYRHGGKAL